MAQESPTALNGGRWTEDGKAQSGWIRADRANRVLHLRHSSLSPSTSQSIPVLPHSSIATKQLQSTMIPLLLITLLASFLPITSIAADSNYPSCVNTCISSNPSNSSWCQGSETGRTRTECICRGLLGAPMLNCIRDCDPADQWAFADGLPDACREKVFPEAEEGDSTNTGAAGRIVGGFGGGLTACVVGVVVVALNG